MKWIIILLMIAVTSEADYLLQYKVDSEQMQFYYKDKTNVKLVPKENICEGGEIYRIGEKIYSVSYAHGKLVTVDLLKAKGFLDAFGVTVTKSEDVAGIYDDYIIEKTSHSKTVAGIKAYKWILKDPQSKETRSIYVSNNQKLIEVTKAMSALFGKFSGDSSDFFAIDKNYVVVESNDMKLLEFKKSTFVKSTFKLPNRHSKKLKMCQKAVQASHIQEREEEPVLQHASGQKASKSESIHKNSSDSNPVSKEDVQKAADLLKSFF